MMRVYSTRFELRTDRGACGIIGKPHLLNTRAARSQLMNEWNYIARAYKAIANGSPCVVPLVDAILPLIFPGMIILMVLCMC